MLVHRRRSLLRGYPNREMARCDRKHRLRQLVFYTATLFQHHFAGFLKESDHFDIGHSKLGHQTKFQHLIIDSPKRFQPSHFLNQNAQLLEIAIHRKDVANTAHLAWDCYQSIRSYLNMARHF